MLCAAIDIGSNTTRVLVAEPQEGQLRKVMEQRAYTRIGKASQHDGAIDADKVAELAEVVATQVRLAEEVGAKAIRTVATAAIREAANRTEVVAEIGRVAGVEVEVLSEHEEGRLAFIGATKTLGHPVEGDLAVVDVGGGSSEVVVGRVTEGMRSVQSFKIGSGSLADDFLSNDPPSPAEIRAVRDHITDFFEGVEFEQPDQAVAVGGSATSLRTLVGAALEYETLERAIRVLTGDPILEVAKRFEPIRGGFASCPPAVLLLEKLSELLGQPLQIGKGGLREGVILELAERCGQRSHARHGSLNRARPFAQARGLRHRRGAAYSLHCSETPWWSTTRSSPLLTSSEALSSSRTRSGSRERPTAMRDDAARPSCAIRSRWRVFCARRGSTRKWSRPACCTTWSRRPTASLPSSPSGSGSDVASLVKAMTEDERIKPFEERKAEHRARVTAAGSRPAAIYAADKLAKMPHLRADPDSASERKLAHFQQTVETLRAGHPDLPFLADLERELAALMAQRQGRAADRGQAAPVHELS